MGIIFLVLFSLAEITLVVLTFTKFTEKVEWLKNRTIIRAAELFVLFVITLIPTVNMKWRFFFALAILALRLLSAGVLWLIKYKKPLGKKNKAATVVNCVFTILLMPVCLAPSFIFTNYSGLSTTGKYKVNETSAILVDKNRADEFENDGSKREVPAHFYYPENAKGEYPLVVFSHGAFGYYQSNFSTYAELASNGYVVVALDHPHHSFFTKDTNGKIITVDQKFIEDAMSTDENMSNEKLFELSRPWIKLRIDDENFVLDTIKQAKKTSSLSDKWYTSEDETVLNVIKNTDTDKIGLIGHSLGGASGAALGRERKDIGAVVDLDGTMLSEVTGVKNGKCEYNNEKYPAPLLVLHTKNNYNEVKAEKEGGFIYVNEYIVDNAKNARMISFKNAGHMDFTDLPLFSPFLSKMLGSGDCDHEQMMKNVNSISLDWFDYYLKGSGELNINAEY